MGSCEATNVVLAKVKNFDPENASKIMGYLLMNLEEYELVRLACCPDHVIHNLAIRVKSHLGMTLSNPSSPSPLNPIGRITSTSTNPFSKSSPRAVANGFDFTRNPASPSSNVWPQPSFQKSPMSPKFNPLLSYENIQTGVGTSAGSSSFSPRVNNGGDCEFVDEQQLNEYFPFLNESSNGDDLVDPRLEMNPGPQNWMSANNGDAQNIHRRSFSASDAGFGVEESGVGFGFKPCLYFARGFCKNGSNCKFVHADSIDVNSAAVVGSPSKFDGMEQHEEFMRFKAAQHQRLLAASQLAAGGTSPSSYDKYIDFLMQQHNDNQRAAAAAAFMMGEEYFNISGRGRPDRNEFLAMVAGDKPNSASRQIYLTFPAESTFKDEDVSEYFSKYGPVQDVRIPYQQKRMFGFVTFVFPETVRNILSKGNPHFICDSRVLVKPYKEKGKVPDKRQHPQQLERSDFSPCLSPSGFEPKEPFDFHPGARMMYNPHDMLLRRKIEEQAELQQVLELQERRLKSLQLPDFKNIPIHHQRSVSVGAPFIFPHQLHGHFNHAGLSPDNIQGDITGYGVSLIPTGSFGAAPEQQLQKEADPSRVDAAAAESGNIINTANSEALDLDTRNVEQTLPESLFASPTKASGDHQSDFSPLEDVNEKQDSTTTAPSNNNASL
ncbi:unnamed protein product [Lathyrus sativus]|nr:unnamed protein product [Lathyrus sativus]